MEGSGHIHPAIRGLKTVCRCNNIKYRTIERAIREGAWNLSQLAERTGATTGHCGGSCTPDVQQMLAELAPRHVTRGACSAAALSGAADARPKTAAGAAAPHSAANQWWVRKK